MRYIQDPETFELIPADEYTREVHRHYVIRDTTTPFTSQADGKVYDSKSNYRRSLKRHGMVELGNDRVSPSEPDSGDIRRDIERAYYQR